MLDRLKKNNREGFTIIEVMIVLAIAGLILLIVFLAVPALQRNARNTQRKNDAGSLVSAISEYIDNNNGSLPNTAANFTNNWKPGYYSAADVTLTNPTPTGATTPTTASAGTAPTTVDQIHVTEYSTCTSTGAEASTATGASSRSIAVTYLVESGGANIEQCITAQ
jgi:prepilin-type N-terminal cleavage/methylation domain-containing protein